MELIFSTSIFILSPQLPEGARRGAERRAILNKISTKMSLKVKDGLRE